MWLLKNQKDGTTKYLISEHKSYTVGRKNCDILIEEDASVSRKHCTFYVTRVNENEAAPTRVWIVDEQSKYGTFLKDDNAWVQINAKERKQLTSGTVIKFGLLGSNWSLEYKPLIACASDVSVDEKKNIKNTLSSVDGLLKNSWCKECSLVIVNEISLTVKVVLALINGVPIVTTNYVQMAVEAIKNYNELPNHDNYRPVIKESILDKSLVSLDPKNHRRELFKGKKFIIPTKKQLEILKDVIISAGGSIELLSGSHAWERFADDDVVVIQLPFNCSGVPEEFIKKFKEIASFLKTNYGKRIVPESEIAQAVAYSSIEKFCNPKSTCFNVRIGERKQLDVGQVIVEDTPSGTEEANPSQSGVVFASATYNSETPLNSNEDWPSRNRSSEPKSQETLQQKPQKILGSQRKRVHGSDEDVQETQNKKARNSEKSGGESSQTPKEPSLVKEGVQNNPKITDRDSSSSAAEDKPSCGTKDELLMEKTRVARQSSSDFWNCEMAYKRKMPSERRYSVEDSSRKKARLLEEMSSEKNPVEVTVGTGVEIASESDKITHANPTPQKIQHFEEEDDFSDYFGKDVSETVVEDLSNTILSLTIISPSYLKADGSLVDPPDVPVNVKRFKKQKIFTAPILNPLEDDELSDGEWIEPHSDRLNVSVVDGE